MKDITKKITSVCFVAVYVFFTFTASAFTLDIRPSHTKQKATIDNVYIGIESPAEQNQVYKTTKTNSQTNQRSKIHFIDCDFSNHEFVIQNVIASTFLQHDLIRNAFVVHCRKYDQLFPFHYYW